MAIATIVQQESHIVTDKPDGVIKEIPFAFSRYQHQLGGETHNKPQSANKIERQSLLNKKGGVLHIQIETGEIRIVHSEEIFFNILAKCGKLDFVSIKMQNRSLIRP